MVRTPVLIAALLAMLGASAGLDVAMAADLEVQVRSADGAPVPDAVVAVHLVGQATPLPRPSGPYVIDQQHIQFHPFVTTVPVGASIQFLNHDAVRHHVYSFSPAKRFELKLMGRQQNQSVLFDKAGIVPLGCNIHDRMLAYVAVMDTPWAKTTDGDGRAVLHDVPAGGIMVTIWHPYLRAAGNSLSRAATLRAGAAHAETFVAPLRTPPHDPGTDY